MHKELERLKVKSKMIESYTNNPSERKKSARVPKFLVR